MNTFDMVYIALIALFFFRGWMKGLMHALIGPACLLFWSIIGIINYDLSSNIITAAGVALGGAAISALIINIIFFLGKQSVHQQHRNYVFIGSRLLGGIVNGAWFGLILAYGAVLLTLMPANAFGLKATQQSIVTSKSYTKFYTCLISPFPAIRNVLITGSVFRHPAILEKYKDTGAYHSVFNDPKIQQLTSDPEIMQKFYSNDALTLINDPKVRSVLTDEQVMAKISNLGKKIYADSVRNK